MDAARRSIVNRRNGGGGTISDGDIRPKEFSHKLLVIAKSGCCVAHASAVTSLRSKLFGKVLWENASEIR